MLRVESKCNPWVPTQNKEVQPPNWRLNLGRGNLGRLHVARGARVQAVDNAKMFYF